MKRLLCLIFLFAWAASFAAEGADKTLSPYFWVKPAGAAAGADEPAADPLPLKSTAVHCTIAGVIADVCVEQVYQNAGAVPLEAVYVFPGSTRAAVHALSFTVGERRIEANIKRREEAKQIYTAAKQAGKSAALLEQQRPNVFQMNVANILPGDQVKVELHYTELLVPLDGVYEFVYPGVVGPRYSNRPAADADSHDAWVANPYFKKGEVDPTRYDVAVHLAAGAPISEAVCRSHRTRIQYQSASEALIQLDPEETAAGNRDFVLRYRLDGDAVQTGLVLAKGGEENFFLVTVQPPQRPAAAAIPPREFIFVVDVSGSMNGFPIATAKKLVTDLLATLRPIDTFDVVLFAGDSQVLAPASLPATLTNIQAANDLLAQQNGGGGTELLPALKRALALPRAESTSRTVAVITDGYVDVEPEVFALVRAELGQANLFAFGIGTSVNRHLIEGLARAGMGEPFVVSDPALATGAASQFRDYISTPVLTNLACTAEGFEIYDAEPAAIPDLMARRPLVIFGKWRGEAKGRIVVNGKNGEGHFRAELPVSTAVKVDSPDALAHLWARRRLEQLDESAPGAERDEAIAALGLKYHLLTRLTSFVAVDEVVRRAVSTLKTIQQPLPLPQGVENTAVGGPVPTSPEPETLGLVVVTVLVAVVAYWRRRIRKSNAGLI